VSVVARIWMRVILMLMLLGLLVSCGLWPTETPLQFPTPLEPTVQPTPILGVEEAGPLPQYRLILALDPVERRLEGQERVTIPNRSGAELGEIIFRLYPNLPQYGGQMTVGPVWVDGERVDASQRAENTSLVVPLARPLAPEEQVTIELTFAVEIPEPAEGYVLFGYNEGIWIAPDAYPLLAGHDGSTWREDIAPAHGDAVFADAAFYDVTLTLPQDLTLVATGTMLSEPLTADNQRVYHLAGGPLREFAWLASANYVTSETSAYGTNLRSYYLPGDEAAGRAALNIAAAALRAYEDAFGPYPFDQMSVAEAPLLHFGMEYASLNLIGVDLYREHGDELEDRVVHEIAHQWWYAQVGNDQVNTPWLDEGLAEYSMAIYYRQVYGQAQVNTLVNQRWLVPYQVAVENGYDAVVNQPSSAFAWEYEVIVYGKAALFYHALHQELGTETFEAVLREYANRYRWRIATPEEFLQVAESVSGQDLDRLYNTWILSSQQE
jgi:hypothetical protein